jgi:hypothetical protein
MSDKFKVVNRGYVSYTDFQNDKLDELKKELLAEGVVCSPYSKTSRSTVKIEKFTSDFNKSELPKKIEEFTKLFRTLLKDLCDFKEEECNIAISAITKTPDNDTNEVFATIIFDNVQKASHFYNELKSTAEGTFKCKPIITIRTSDDTETLTNLVAFGVKKDKNIPLADF